MTQKLNYYTWQAWSGVKWRHNRWWSISYQDWRCFSASTASRTAFKVELRLLEVFLFMSKSVNSSLRWLLWPTRNNVTAHWRSGILHSSNSNSSNQISFEINCVIRALESISTTRVIHHTIRSCGVIFLGVCFWETINVSSQWWRWHRKLIRPFSSSVFFFTSLRYSLVIFGSKHSAWQ